MDKAGPSRSRRSRSRRSRTQITPDGDVRPVHSRDEDWDVPQAQKKLKGKAIQPEGSRRSAFQRLGHEGRNQNRPTKERLGVETTPLSAFNRLGRGAERPGRTGRTEPPHREEPQHSRAPHGEEEAESHPRHTIRSHVEQPRDRVGRVEARLEKLQRRVDRDEKKKILLNESPFTDRVHETPFPKKAKLEVPKFTGKEDPEIHVKTLHQSGRMMGLSGDEKCLLFSKPSAAEPLSGFITYRPSYQEAYNTAWDYADAEAQVSSKREAEQGHSKGKVSLKKEIEQPGRAKAAVMEVKPVKSEKNPTGEKQWTEKYCSFHKTDSHNTAECNSVKGVIKQMIEAGEIDPEYLAQAKQKKNQWIRPEGKPVEQNKKKKAPGQPGINKVRGVISMAHLCMKFYTPGGIGQVRGDQKKARHCYLEAVKKMTKAFERVTLVSQEEDRSKLEPGDETEQIVLREAFPERMVRIEYEALAGCLRLAQALGIKRMRIRSDSSLVVGQINGEMEVKEERLARYGDLVRALLRELEEFRLTRIPESENTDADMLSKLMQSCPEHVSKLAKIESLDQPSTDRFEVAAIQPGQNSATGIIGTDDDWRYDLMEYLETGQKPDDEERARKVVLRAPRFQVIDGHLYKRAIGGPLLRCLTNPEAERGNGQVENANWTIVDGLKKRLGEEGHKWLEALPHTVWAHRVTSRRATGETPFVLTYGCEARFPVEAEIPTFRETVYQPGQNEVDHLAELNLVEE
ncbi:unnamed protein product [Cuscuta campestris]|uniref:RNase H type-1 domain-containing protein n=1 Tax=Cuscuta campestris TaxID=132261 RepID=A0A484NRM6_9ASTE|nr:unnamed protein product [Cuscuta campestris]